LSWSGKFYVGISVANRTKEHECGRNSSEAGNPITGKSYVEISVVTRTKEHECGQNSRRVGNPITKMNTLEKITSRKENMIEEM
jgi:hypothetical protein